MLADSELSTARGCAAAGRETGREGYIFPH